MDHSEDGWELHSQQSARLPNSAILDNLDIHLDYLADAQKGDVWNLIQSYPTLFGDVPSRTTVLEHDVDVGDASPIKQHTYQCSLPKRELMKMEVEYLLKNGQAKPSCSSWSSPCLLTPKSDGSPRFLY